MLQPQLLIGTFVSGTCSVCMSTAGRTILE